MIIFNYVIFFVKLSIIVFFFEVLSKCIFELLNRFLLLNIDVLYDHIVGSEKIFFYLLVGITVCI